MKELKEFKLQTDCGEIVVREYDDGIANGVNIHFNGALVAAVDCYKNTELPTQVDLWLSELIKETSYTEDEAVDAYLGDYLSGKYGYCINSFRFNRTGDKFHIYDIDWDQDVPEARLLIYNPALMNEDCDKPTDYIELN